MRPILLRWGRFTFWSYPTMLYVGLVLGVFAGNAAAHAAGLDAFRVFLATFLLLVPALLGARLLFVLTHWDLFRDDWRTIWDRRVGGAAQYGGLLLMLPLSIAVLAALRLRLGAFWDVASFTILIGMFFTRFGCFLNGCCAGRPWRWGPYLPNHHGRWERRVPTQMLEALLTVSLLVAAIEYWPARPFAGSVFLLVMGGYGAGRLVLETLRERPAGARAVTVHHVISLAMVVVAAATLTVASR